MFDIEFTAEAQQDLKLFSSSDRRLVVDRIEEQLRREPDVETRNRKLLRPNQIADWELRIGRFRVFYDIEPQTNTIIIKAAGWKIGSRLYIGGEEFRL